MAKKNQKSTTDVSTHSTRAVCFVSFFLLLVENHFERGISPNTRPARDPFEPMTARENSSLGYNIGYAYTKYQVCSSEMDKNA